MKCKFRFAFSLIVSTGARVATLLIYHRYWALSVYGPLESGPLGSGDGGLHTIPAPVNPNGDNFSPV